MPHIIITGLAGSGKSTLARKIELDKGYQVISCDDYRYLGNWVRKSYLQYRHDILSEINKDGSPKIIEGAYLDAHDPENSRIRVFNELISQGFIQKVYIIHIDKIVQASRLIDRCINRVTGVESQGTCVESSINRGCLLVKAIENYEKNTDALKLFKLYIDSFNIEVEEIHINDDNTSLVFITNTRVLQV
jgi:dephospho-CoA kinase